MLMRQSRRQCEQRLVSGDTRKQRTTSGEFPRLQTFVQDQILGMILTIISGSLFEGFRKKVTNKKENGSSARFSVRLVHVRGRLKTKTSAPRFPAYLSGELQTHDEIRLDR